MRSSDRTLETLAPWLTGAVLACPVLVAYYPPMTDLPFHEAAIAILRHLHDATRYPPGLYERNLGEPNQLFHMVGWGLAYVLSTRWTVKLLVAGTVAAIPVCAARLARHAGSSPLAALVVAPVALGWLFSWGLVANLIGLAMLLVTLPALDELGVDPTPRRALVALGAIVLLYFAHMAMMTAYAGAALGLTMLFPWSWRKSTWRLSPFAAGVAITVAQLQWQKQYTTFSLRAISTAWDPISRKLADIPTLILPSADAVVKGLTTGLCLYVVGSLLWLRWRERRAQGVQEAGGGRLARARIWALAHRWDVFAATAFVAYLGFPLTLHGATLVYQRWLPPAFAVLAACSAPRDMWSRAAFVPRLGVYVLPLATLIVAVPSFADSDRQYRQLEKLASEVEVGNAVADLELGPGDPTRTYSLGSASGRILALRGGRLDYSFTESSVSPVFMTPEHQWEGAFMRLGFDPWAFRPQHDFRMFRYLLVRTTNADLARLVARALRDEARLVDTAGEWLLFESRLPVISILSPALKMHRPLPEQLRERLARMLAGTGVTLVPGQRPQGRGPLSE